MATTSTAADREEAMGGNKVDTRVEVRDVSMAAEKTRDMAVDNRVEVMANKEVMAEVEAGMAASKVEPTEVVVATAARALAMGNKAAVAAATTMFSPAEDQAREVSWEASIHKRLPTTLPSTAAVEAVTRACLAMR